MLNKERAVIEGLPVSLVPEGLLAAVHLLVVMVQCGEASKGAAALPTNMWLLAAWMAWCLTRRERYLKLLSHVSHLWALSPSVFLSWVPKEGVGSPLITLLGTFFFGGCPVCSV